MTTHPHLEGLIRLRERIRMASVMACGGIPNAEAAGWSDELREIIQALAALPGGGVDAQDAERYRWLKSRLLCADFHYGQGVDQRAVIVFEWPESARISANLDASIDAQNPTPTPHEADRNG